MTDGADSLSQYFANIITSRHNQHAMVKIVGRAGMGKSWAGIELATETAKCVAEKKGGDYTQYFNFKDNLACMSITEIERVMTNPRMYSIIFLDDIGVPLNSRKWQSDTNIKFNNIIQTFRPNHNLVIMTMQAGFLIDKVPRTIAGYEIEMISNDFNKGITIAKLNEVVMKHKTGKIFYPYLYLNGMKYKRYIFDKPDKALTIEYEKMRAEQLDRMKKEELEPEGITKMQSMSPSEMMVDLWTELKQAGWSLREIARPSHVAASTVSDALKKAGVVV